MMYKNYNQKKLQKYLIIFVCIAAFLFSCKSQEISQPIDLTDFLLMSNLEPLNIKSEKSASLAIQNYFKRYFKIIPNLKINSGYYISPRTPFLSQDQGEISNDLLLVAHILTGEKSDKGTAVLVHGYTGSSRYVHFQYFAQQFIKNGYRVVLLNLPGHEFSGGYRGSVENFEDYGNMVIEFLSQYRTQLGKTVHMIGMSTGSISLFDAMRRNETLFSSINKVALIVPFLYVKNSGILNFASYFARSIRGKKSGPLTIYRIPGKWMREAHKWSKARNKETHQIQNKNVFIAFAEKDQTIDVKKSQRFYKMRYPYATIKTYAGQDHLLSKQGYENFQEDIMTFFLSKEYKD